MPYYYYVVRSDCPPRYRDWYGQRIRLSSWDDRRRWNDLWGGPLRRYKSDPPAGYVPPSGGGNWSSIGGGPGPNRTPRFKPPGYLDSPRIKGGAQGLPIGRRTRPGAEGSPETREVRGRSERMPWRPAPPREDDGEAQRPSRDPGEGRREAPRWEPRVEPQREPQRKPDAPPPPREKPSPGENRGGKGGGGGKGKGGGGGER